jgi:hypothetical protein
MRWVGHVACMREIKKFIHYFSWNEGKRPLGRPRNMWEDNVKIDIQEIRFVGVDRCHLA